MEIFIFVGLWFSFVGFLFLVGNLLIELLKFNAMDHDHLSLEMQKISNSVENFSDASCLSRRFILIMQLLMTPKKMAITLDQRGHEVVRLENGIKS